MEARWHRRGRQPRDTRRHRPIGRADSRTDGSRAGVTIPASVDPDQDATNTAIRNGCYLYLKHNQLSIHAQVYTTMASSTAIVPRRQPKAGCLALLSAAAVLASTSTASAGQDAGPTVRKG